jgi:hypothetical protein
MTAIRDDLLTESVAWRPPAALDGFVSGCHGFHHVLSGPGTHHGLPSSAMTVVIAFDDPLDVGWLDEPATRDTFWGLASGLHTKPAEIFHHGRQLGIQLGLTVEGARHVLGLPMGTLARDLVAIEDLLPVASAAGTTASPASRAGDVASNGSMSCCSGSCTRAPTPM